MKTYIEAFELRTEATVVEEPDFIRIDLDDLPEDEAVALVRRLMIPPYVIQKHYCYHDEDSMKPCRAEVVEVVGG